jgi:HEAT repeat protein/protein-S-isoprenylcysteine O-methyltransferase Ste14
VKNKKWPFGIYLVALAVIFSIGLTFASVELPRLLNSMLEEATPALEGDSHADEGAVYRTELFLEHYHFRLVGYICFGLMVILVVAGFASGRAGLSSLGAAALFLPVFAQFAGVMFFLSGLGFLNLAWLPVLDVSFDLGRLGDIVYVPYDALVSFSRGLGLDVHQPLVYLLLGMGLLLLALGTLAWLVARHRKRDLADFWVYRLCRHPQYLGWIVWSYGMLLSLKHVRYPKRSWGIPASLPWLLSMMVIVGVALLEERKMKRLAGARYDRYRSRTSFLFPLPRFLRKAGAAPNRLLFGKSFPERKGEIGAVLLISTVLLVLASHFYSRYKQYAGLDIPAGAFSSESGRVRALIAEMKRTDNWRRKFGISDALADIGQEAAGPLVGLLNEADPETRREAIRALGRIAPPEATEPLLRKLEDEDGNVRLAAIDALGRMRSREAVGPLLSILEAGTSPDARGATVALGRIGSEAAVGPLLAFLDSPNWWDRTAAAEALGGIGSEAAIEPLASRFKEEDVRVRRAIVVALLRIGSSRARPTLEEALRDEDREVRLYAAQAVKKVRAGV